MNPKINIQKFVISAMVAAVLSLGAVVFLLYKANHSLALGGDFSANSIQGPWKFSTDAKDLNLVYVGYAKCPDVCPMALSYASQAFKKLTEAELKNTRFIFLSVDVQHDTIQNVSDYAAQFFPSFIGLSGTQNEIDEAVKKIGATYIVEPNPKSYLGYSIAHSDRIFFLNKQGLVIDSLPNPRDADTILSKIKEHL